VTAECAVIEPLYGLRLRTPRVELRLPTHDELVELRDIAHAGIQTLHGADFPTSRTVGTGSWLGSRFQGRGYGTEMRAAVLELAFRGLSAVAATSGAMGVNVASRRVLEKLGYRIVGRGEVSPRGTPVPHLDLRIGRGDWRSPVPVEIEGLALCLHLFGVGHV
jgi:RimJ/RimL family protein N-acetyltransferase